MGSLSGIVLELAASSPYQHLPLCCSHGPPSDGSRPVKEDLRGHISDLASTSAVSGAGAYIYIYIYIYTLLFIYYDIYYDICYDI